MSTLEENVARRLKEREHYPEVQDLAVQLCERLGIVPSYCYRIDLDLGTGQAQAYLYQGEDGRYKGKKYLVNENGERAMGTWKQPGGYVHPATEVITIPIR